MSLSRFVNSFATASEGLLVKRGSSVCETTAVAAKPNQEKQSLPHDIFGATSRDDGTRHSLDGNATFDLVLRMSLCTLHAAAHVVLTPNGRTMYTKYLGKCNFHPSASVIFEDCGSVCVYCRTT